jgi:hypothetical protein
MACARPMMGFCPLPPPRSATSATSATCERGPLAVHPGSTIHALGARADLISILIVFDWLFKGYNRRYIFTLTLGPPRETVLMWRKNADLPS